MLCGKTLINATTIDIIKTHRVARRYLSEPLALDKTLPLVQQLSTLELAPAELILANLPASIGSNMTMSMV